MRLTRFAGASLPDPRGHFDAMRAGNKARAIDFREGDRLEVAALKALVRAGVQANLARARPASGLAPAAAARLSRRG